MEPSTSTSSRLQLLFLHTESFITFPVFFFNPSLHLLQCHTIRDHLPLALSIINMWHSLVPKLYELRGFSFLLFNHHYKALLPLNLTPDFIDKTS